MSLNAIGSRGLAISVLVGERCFRAASLVLGLLDAEFILEFKANGGAVIAFRSFWFSMWTYLLILGTLSYSEPDAIFHFSTTELQTLFQAHIEWLGGIFVASYVALYSRFAAQWAYLAGLYNQISQSRAETCGTKDESPPSSASWAIGLPGFTEREQCYAVWMAGFVADALTLHLARKDLFRESVHDMLTRKGVKEAFLDAGNERDLDQFLAWYKA